MSHNEVYKWFNLYFGQYSGINTELWFPNGKNSIRIRQTNKQEFVFTCNSPKDWKFETIKSYMNSIKK
ncbi:MAG TPA: methionyl-tRNA synthetase [Mobilitalea sp.]|nr:methionyl-tRNA synthetase [Mobilitalea sp.]